MIRARRRGRHDSRCAGRIEPAERRRTPDAGWTAVPCVAGRVPNHRDERRRHADGRVSCPEGAGSAPMRSWSTPAKEAVPNEERVLERISRYRPENIDSDRVTGPPGVDGGAHVRRPHRADSPIGPSIACVKEEAVPTAPKDSPTPRGLYRTTDSDLVRVGRAVTSAVRNLEAGATA